MGNYIEISFKTEGKYIIIRDKVLNIIKKLAKSNDGSLDIKTTRHDNFNSKFYYLNVSGTHGAFKDLFSNKIFKLLKKSIIGNVSIFYEDMDAPESLNVKIKGVLKH